MTRASSLVTTCLLSAFITSLATSLVSAQDTAAVMDRYNNLGLIPDGPTVDAALARKMLRRGNTYSNLERFDEAIAEYRKAIAADPNLAEALRNLANVYYFLQRFNEVKPVLARYIALQNEPSAALLAAVQTMGELERQDGNFTGAIDYDLRAIELDADNDSQVHIMANTYNNAGAPDLAIRVYRQAITMMPDNAFFERSLGRILQSEGRLEEALAAYRAASQKDPDSEFYRNLVSRLEQQLGQ